MPYHPKQLDMRRYLVIVVGAILFGFSISTILRDASGDRAVLGHLRKYEYWQRAQFGKLTRKDIIAPETWSELLGPKPDPQRESKKESDALIALGYLVKHSFNFLPVTNRAAFPELERAIRAAKFSDAHWEYSIYSNRIDVVICARDLTAWEAIVKKWENERPQATNLAPSAISTATPTP